MSKCECPEEGIVPLERLFLYDAKTERPFANHKAGECKCANDLRKYMRDKKVLTLCSCCVMLGDKPITEN